MKLPPLKFGRLIKRYKRFLVDVETESGEVLTIYSPNTGKMLGCSTPGSRIAYSDSMSTTRKLRYTLELVENQNGWVGVRPDLANHLVEEAIKGNQIEELAGYNRCKAEVPYGKNCRADFLLSEHSTLPDCFVEVKSATCVAEDGCYIFPDAPSIRAVKQLREMMVLRQQGLRCVVLYVVQCSGGNYVRAAKEIDPDYAEIVEEAKRKGIEFYARYCRIDNESITIDDALIVM